MPRNQNQSRSNAHRVTEAARASRNHGNAYRVIDAARAARSTTHNDESASATSSGRASSNYSTTAARGSFSNIAQTLRATSYRAEFTEEDLYNAHGQFDLSTFKSIINNTDLSDNEREQAMLALTEVHKKYQRRRQHPVILWTKRDLNDETAFHILFQSESGRELLLLGEAADVARTQIAHEFTIRHGNRMESRGVQKMLCDMLFFPNMTMRKESPADFTRRCAFFGLPQATPEQQENRPATQRMP